MDVLSLRKTGGKVKGDVRVNGHTQEANTFRRMSGYVEQFDVQSPQLTIRETVEFSTKMRLDESIPVETKLKFSEKILDMLELNSIGHLLVGSDTGGLSFEQRKR
jgi:ABC-type multidrug transport system ATPase subunit